MRKIVFVVLTIVCLLLSPFASSLPDGLETVLEGEHLGSLIKQLDWPIMADYSVSIIAYPILGSWLAGLSGVLIVAMLFMSATFIKRHKVNENNVKNKVRI